MRVVLVGARTRLEPTDEQLVNNILDVCMERYPSLIVVAASCDKGVGNIVKSRNEDYKRKNGSVQFNMLELSMRHYLIGELPRPEFTQHWNALNATLVELGDEFHLLLEQFPKGSMLDLMKRVKNSGMSYSIYLPSEKCVERKPCVYNKDGEVLLRQ